MGLLARPSRGPKLPDLECAALLSLPPPADCPGCIPCCLAGCSYGVTWLPIGVARCRVGRGGLAGGWIVRLPTGLAFGDGGMARPNLGAARPRLPGMAGRRRGAGEFIIGTDIGVDAGVGTAEEEEETGCCSGAGRLVCVCPGDGECMKLTSWAAGSVPWGCEGAASAMVSSAGQGSLSRYIQTSELLMVVRWQGTFARLKVGAVLKKYSQRSRRYRVQNRPRQKKKRECPNSGRTKAALNRRQGEGQRALK